MFFEKKLWQVTDEIRSFMILGVSENGEDQKWIEMGMGQNLVPLVNIKIAGKWIFIP